MTLLDLLLNGPVPVMDLDHEQYGDAAELKRQGIVVQKGDIVEITPKGKAWLLEHDIQMLQANGLAERFGELSTVTAAGVQLLNGSERVM